MELTDAQRAVRDFPAHGSLFVHGPAGAGKTTAAALRLLALLESGVSGAEILIMAPQRGALRPYQRALRASGYAGPLPLMLTIGGLARQMSAQFFPLAAADMGFADPEAPPVFLTLETAQYVMARLVDPLAFAATGVRVDRQRIFSQILDNLNKAALVGFPQTEIAERLKAASRDAAAHPAYDQAGYFAAVFRAYCLEHNLLDFSLQLEMLRHLYRLDAPRRWLLTRARHLFADNIEEDAPTAHALIGDLIAAADSALLVYDRDGGYRYFLGADPLSAWRLGDACAQTAALEGSFVMSPAIAGLAGALGAALGGPDEGVPPVAIESLRAALDFPDHTYFPQMLDWTADTIAQLVAAGVPPGEIVVLAPFMADSLRFSLIQRLEARGIPARSQRPSRALREEPAVECLLTWAQIAHPEWNLTPPDVDALAYALMLSLGGIAGDDLDLVRARLLAGAAYPADDQPARLRPFTALPPDVRQRVSYLLGQRYDVLRLWLEEYIAGKNRALTPADAPPEPTKGRKRGKRPAVEPLAPAPPQRAELDHFFSLLFGEVLSRRGFGFHRDFIAADAAASLIDSARGFRQTMAGRAVFESNLEGKTLAEEYVEMVRGGVIANQYLRPDEERAPDAVLLAPAYTFLNNNVPVTVQFWLDIGSRAWFERLYQPLTHPHVLSLQWPIGRIWTDDDEDASRRETLRSLVYGLLRRCRARVYLGYSQLSESGHESAGELLAAINRALRRLQAAPEVTDDRV
ncbi:MAG: hypothetical protein ACUVS2_09755 [Candidatus Flexifilum sp.]